MAELDATLLERLRRGRAPEARLRASVALDLGEEEGWTLHLQPERVALSAGVDPGADTTIVTDPATVTAILNGSSSGVEAFLDGRLRVRGNLALSLRLASVLGIEDVPAHFEKAKDITALVCGPSTSRRVRVRQSCCCTDSGRPTPRCCRRCGTWPPTTAS